MLTSEDNPHKSIHPMSSRIYPSFERVAPKVVASSPAPGSKSADKQKGPASDDPHDSAHQNDTSTTVIVVDSMRDIGTNAITIMNAKSTQQQAVCSRALTNFYPEIFATPIIVTIVKELVESFIAKEPSVDSLLDDFQMMTISEKFKVRKYLHNKTQLNVAAHSINLQLVQVYTTSHTLPKIYKSNSKIGLFV